MQIFQHIITAMLFFQIIMVALFGIKKAPGPAVLTAPLPFITVAFLLYNLKMFNRPQVLISNRTAADIDKRHSQVNIQSFIWLCSMLQYSYTLLRYCMPMAPLSNDRPYRDVKHYRCSGQLLL